MYTCDAGHRPVKDRGPPRRLVVDRLVADRLVADRLVADRQTGDA
ncbi:MAG: hypothetical protein ABI910_18935 [Gemmatimonadota bacterium]